MRITGKEKAFIGGLGAGMVAFAGQLSANSNVDVKTVAWSLGAWLFTHVVVYYTTDTPVTEDRVVQDATALGAAVAAAEKPATPVAPAGQTEPTPPAAPAA